MLVVRPLFDERRVGGIVLGLQDEGEIIDLGGADLDQHRFTSACLHVSETRRIIFQIIGYLLQYQSESAPVIDPTAPTTGFMLTRFTGSVSYIRISTTTPKTNMSSAI